MKVPGWVDKLLKKKPQLERALGMPLGRVFGCGHFGCVFESEPPWSVKLTRDPTEGPIWQLLADWMREAPYGDDGIARVKEVVRLKPDIRWRGKEWPLHGIVREEVEPLLENDRLSDYTQKKLGWHISLHTLLGNARAINALPQPAKGNAIELRDLLRGLNAYQAAAADYHHAMTLKRPSNRERRMDNAMEQLSRATDMMHGPVGGPIGETLSVLTHDAGVVLRDVHWNNIGWRVHKSIGDEQELPLSLIIFDPGHTPTEEREVRTEMLENPWPVALPNTRSLE